MRPRTLADVARAVGGSIGPWDDGGAVERSHGSPGSAVITGVGIDSRTVTPGDLFVALPGERSDGHAFVMQALAAGAAGAMVATGHDIPGAGTATAALPFVMVDDPGRGLLSLAASERDGMRAVVVGITGSTGKTCTKDFTAAVLGTHLRTISSPGSFNNEIGLPLTVLSAAGDTEALVLEMGARGLGHIRLLCEIARPRIGVVTNVGVAHLELFGTAGAIENAKAELPESLPADGTAVLNADDPAVAAFAKRTRAGVLRFGAADDADIRAVGVALDPGSGRASFVMRTPAGDIAVTLPVAGAHMVPNALAAAAVGHALGLSPTQIASGLAKAKLSSGRMDVFVTVGGVRVIDDAYNANPTSMAAALKTARSMAGAGRCVVVLGGMAELGPIAAEEHERVGELIVRLGIDRLIVVGDDAEAIATAAEREGLEPSRIVRARSVDEAIASVVANTASGDLVLVKASRVAGLDRVARALAGDDPSLGRGGGVAA